MKWLFLVTILCMPISAHAQLVVTEIMYDVEGSDSGREWIEVQNVGANAVALASWRLLEGGVKHKIVGKETIAPGSFAVIADNPAKFRTDWPEYSGPLFDSAFSLSNEGETLILLDPASVEASAAYQGSAAQGTGDSLQRDPSGSAFAAGSPTPGAGIPSGGLVARQPVPKKSKAKAPVETTRKESEVLGESVAAATSTELLSIDTAQRSSLPWLFPILLASGASSGILWSRKLSKSEWVIEEMGETG